MLTQDTLKELIDYNPDTGIFTWRVRDRKWFTRNRLHKGFNSQFAGKEAGTKAKCKCGKHYILITISILGVQTTYRAHRLAHLYMLGYFPEVVDHDDGNGTNNKWSNIKKTGVTVSDNTKNQRRSKRNTSGITGVYIPKGRWKYHAYITIHKKMEYLGTFDNVEDAILARKSAEDKYGYHINHGSDRPL